MLKAMPASLFEEWAVYLRREPWGDEVTCRQLNTLCVMVARFVGIKGVKDDDFMPKSEKPGPPKAKSNAELHAKFLQYAKLHDAKVGANGA